MELRPSERWRPVIGYETLYEVSDEGRVRRRKSRRLLTPFPPTGDTETLYVSLRKDGGKRRHSVARLVAEAFLGPGRAEWVPGHKSDDVTNNRVGNLEWLSQSEFAARCFRRQPRARAEDGEFTRLSEVLNAVEAAAVHASVME